MRTDDASFQAIRKTRCAEGRPLLKFRRNEVLEFFREQLRLPRERVAAFACWDVMNWIAASRRESIFSNAGFEAYESPDPDIQRLSRQQFDTPTPWDSVRHDSYTFAFARAHLGTHRPRVLYISLGETDDWAHDRRYDRVLQALHRSDRQIHELWDWLQSQNDYRDKTALYFTTDHGRGDDPQHWMDHNEKLDGAAYIWFAAAGAGIQARGEIASGDVLGQNQIAATLAAALNLDFLASRPHAGAPIELFKQP